MKDDGKKIDIDHGYDRIELHVFRPARGKREATMRRYSVPKKQWGTPPGARRLLRFVRLMSANIRQYWGDSHA